MNTPDAIDLEMSRQRAEIDLKLLHRTQERIADDLLRAMTLLGCDVVVTARTHRAVTPNTTGGAVFETKSAGCAGDVKPVESSPCFPKTERPGQPVPGCRSDASAPEGPGRPVNKPLMRTPRAPLDYERQPDRDTAGDILSGTKEDMLHPVRAQQTASRPASPIPHASGSVGAPTVEVIPAPVHAETDRGGTLSNLPANPKPACETGANSGREPDGGQGRVAGNSFASGSPKHSAASNGGKLVGEFLSVTDQRQAASYSLPGNKLTSRSDSISEDSKGSEIRQDEPARNPLPWQPSSEWREGACREINRRLGL